MMDVAARRQSPGPRAILGRLLARTLFRIRQQWPRLLILATLALGAALLIEHGPLPMATGQAGSNDQADEFMRALRDRDGPALWNAKSDDLRRRLAGRTGASASQQGERALARLLVERSHVTAFQEVAHHSLKQGGTVHFFLAAAGDRSNSEVEVPFTVTVGADGRVTEVE